MFRESIRPMNNRERGYLQDLIAPTGATVPLAGTVKWVGVWTSGLVLCLLMVSGLVMLGVHPILWGAVAGVIASAGIVCLFAIMTLITGYLRWRGYDRAFLRDEVPLIAAALEDGTVSVKSVAASAVIVLEEFEDEGSGAIFDIGGGKILFLKGQHFFPVDEDMEWPNTEFEIVRTASGNRWVGIFCSGQHLEPSRVIPLADCPEEFAWGEDHEEILEANLNDFATSLLSRNDPTEIGTRRINSQ